MAQFLVYKLKIWWIIFFLTSAVCLLTLTGFFGHFWWIFDITSHFRVQYCVILTLFALLFLVGRKYWQTGIAGGGALINFFLIVPLSFGGAIVASEKVSVRVLKINLQITNTAYDKVKNLIQSTAPDVLILEEYDEVWRKNLDDALNDYPFSAVSTWKNGWGIGLFSRLPMEKAEARLIEASPMPFVTGEIIVEGKPVTLFGSHLQDPTTSVRANVRNIQLSGLAQVVKEIQNPVILLGDLNISPWSPHFKDFIEESGLDESRKKTGLRLTWPTNFFPLKTSIDHCLSSAGVLIHSVTLGPDIGSDHYPVVVDFSVQ
jgi:endonuclease/exonuclease/phosphatase (EEP) superfamily protein YafD